MTINVEEYQKLRTKASEIKSEIDRAQGTLATLMKSLKTEFDCDSVEEAEAALATMEKELKEAEETYESEMKKFKEKYGDLLK